MLLPNLVSVIMPTVDPLQEHTQRAIRSLSLSTVPYELILLSRNHEWTTGSIVNQGLAAAVGGYIAFCCDDCFVEPLALARMKEALQDPTVGIAGAYLSYPNGLVQHAGGDFFASRTLDGEGMLLNIRHVDQGKTPAPHYEARDVDFVTGALMMMRRNTVEELGGYDERCDLTWGDVDYSLRARQVGYRVRFVPEARAIHQEATTRGSATGSHQWFLDKWRIYLDNVLLPQAQGVAS